MLITKYSFHTSTVGTYRRGIHMYYIRMYKVLVGTYVCTYFIHNIIFVCMHVQYDNTGICVQYISTYVHMYSMLVCTLHTYVCTVCMYYVYSMLVRTVHTYIRMYSMNFAPFQSVPGIPHL